jgi:uncharacterized protein (DUF1778 family)
MTIERRRKKPKKDKVITLRMNKHSYDIIEEYAEARGLSVNAYLNSVADSQAEWFIPFSSYDLISLGKKQLATLFEFGNENFLEQMAQHQANEGKNCTLLTHGVFTLATVIDMIRRECKYSFDSDIRITKINPANGVHNFDRNSVGPELRTINNNRNEDDNQMDNEILIVLRHDLGRNFSIYWSKFCLYFFNLLKSRKVSVNYDSTTVSIKLERMN